MKHSLSMKESLKQLRHDSSILKPVEVQPIPCVDALTFVTSPEYLDQHPYAFQRVALKTLYHLWEKYPADAEEAEFLRLEREEWGIDVDLRSEAAINHMILVLGRRAGKTTLLSYIATYGVLQLICRGNPQAYYGLSERQPIHLLHVAGREEQAKVIFNISRDIISRVGFFKPYIDFDKNNSNTLRLFTPYDLALIAKRVGTEGGEQSKRTGLPGSLYIESVPTVAATNRGKSIYLLMISEFAHLQRPGPDASQQADYEILKALAPSVKDFGPDGKIILESSPAEKGGEFYKQYCLSGGPEQEQAERPVARAGYQVFQASTWQVNPNISAEAISSEFDADPFAARQEYGAHFADPSSSFISPGLIEAMVVRDRPGEQDDEGRRKFIVSVDPGGASKSSRADTYAIAWGHYEKAKDCCWIDGLHCFESQKRLLPEGGVEWVAVDAIAAVNYVIDLGRKWGGPSAVLEIVYDQWNSQLPIALLERSGYYAHKTDFTNPYKKEMVGTFLTMLRAGKVRISPEADSENVERLKRQLRYLQRETSGDTVRFHGPSTGTERHDDFAMAGMNLVLRLVCQAHPTKDVMADNHRRGGAPMALHTGIKPVKGPPLWGPRRRNIPDLRGRI